MSKGLRKLAAMLLTAIILCGSALPALADYWVYNYYNNSSDYQWACTWIAWQKAKDRGYNFPGSWGNAGYWYGKAKSAGYTVNSQPSVDSIACWSINSSRKMGHVAYVLWVSDDYQTIYVVEGGNSGAASSHGLCERYITRSSSSWPDQGFIHLDPGYVYDGWEYIGDSWYYHAESGGYAVRWWKLGSNWYYFGTDGKMATGWVRDGSGWYYMNSAGVMQTGWLRDGNSWYYLSSGGSMVTGWLKDGGKWYLFSPDGKMATGWVSSGGQWYYFKGSGAMAANEWIQDKDGSWYWLDKDGHMATGRKKINGKWEEFSDSGRWLGN